LRTILLVLAVVIPACAELRLQMTVIQPKTGEAVLKLTAADFNILEDKNTRRVEAAEYRSGPVDVMLLLDTSLAGEMVRGLADDIIEQLQEKEQMAVVSYHTSADLIQDFTSSKQLLGRAIASVKYGNEPNALDALYAAIDGGFQSATYRRVVLLLTAGIEGRSRVSEQQVIKVARRSGVSIYPVFVSGYERSMFEKLARGTGGATLNLRELRRVKEGEIARRIFEVVRGYYLVTVAGNFDLSEKARLEVKRPEKLFVSALPLE
jgi:VWFA-related protein